MFLEKWDKLIFGKGKFWIYFLGVMLVLYFDRYNINIIFEVSLSIIKLTIFWIIFIIIPRKYFLDTIKKFNRYLYNYFRFILKFRKIFIYVSKFIQIIVSFFIFIDQFLIKLLVLETNNNDTISYFIKNFLYCNIMMIILLPFYFIKELYYIVLKFCDSDINIKDYLEWRLHFLLLSIIFILLLNVKRIDIIIIIWIVDTVITFYYSWWKEFKDLKEGENINLRVYSILLMLAFKSTGMTYNELLNSIILDVNMLRNYTILFFKGLSLDEIENLKFDWYKNLENYYYKNYWVNYYISWLTDRENIFYYYSSVNEEHFKLWFLYILFEEELENNKLKFLNKVKVNELVYNTFDVRFHKYQYDMLINLCLKLRNNEDLIEEFLKLKYKYGSFLYSNEYNEEDIKNFMYKIKSK
jgi:hypothetical protein